MPDRGGWACLAAAAASALTVVAVVGMGVLLVAVWYG